MYVVRAIADEDYIVACVERPQPMLCGSRLIWQAEKHVKLSDKTKDKLRKFIEPGQMFELCDAENVYPEAAEEFDIPLRISEDFAKVGDESEFKLWDGDNYQKMEYWVLMSGCKLYTAWPNAGKLNVFNESGLIIGPKNPEKARVKPAEGYPII
jgi:hypothetical protein